MDPSRVPGGRRKGIEAMQRDAHAVLGSGRRQAQGKTWAGLPSIVGYCTSQLKSV